MKKYENSLRFFQRRLEADILIQVEKAFDTLYLKVTVPDMNLNGTVGHQEFRSASLISRRFPACFKDIFNIYYFAERRAKKKVR